MGRCDRTDLLVSECACRDHRGGRTPEEEAASDAVALRQRLLSGVDGHHWREAKYPGRCSGCSEWFQVGTAIRSNNDGAGWLAECCTEGDTGEH